MLGKIWEIYATQQLLAALGQGVVSQLGKVHQAGAPFPSAEHLDQWLAAWESIADVPKAQEFALPLRLLRVGIAFLKTGGTDHSVLLTLTKPERKILQQALGMASG